MNLLWIALCLFVWLWYTRQESFANHKVAHTKYLVSGHSLCPTLSPWLNWEAPIEPGGGVGPQKQTKYPLGYPGSMTSRWIRNWNTRYLRSWRGIPVNRKVRVLIWGRSIQKTYSVKIYGTSVQTKFL